jgi:hypothetical protein
MDTSHYLNYCQIEVFIIITYLISTDLIKCVGGFLILTHITRYELHLSKILIGFLTVGLLLIEIFRLSLTDVKFFPSKIPHYLISKHFYLYRYSSLKTENEMPYFVVVVVVVVVV